MDGACKDTSKPGPHFLQFVSCTPREVFLERCDGRMGDQALTALSSESCGTGSVNTETVAGTAGHSIDWTRFGVADSLTGLEEEHMSPDNVDARSNGAPVHENVYKCAAVYGVNSDVHVLCSCSSTELVAEALAQDFYRLADKPVNPVADSEGDQQYCANDPATSSVDE
eukprot:scpid97195/ scgid1378/ 